MLREEYITSIKINNRDVDIGVTEKNYYFYEIEDNKGQVIRRPLCKSDNNYFVEMVYYQLDPIYHELLNKDICGELTDYEKGKFQLYKRFIEREIEKIKEVMK